MISVRCLIFRVCIMGSSPWVYPPAQKPKSSLKPLVSSVLLFDFFRKLGSHSTASCLICRWGQSFKDYQGGYYLLLLLEDSTPAPFALCFSEIGNSPVIGEKDHSHLWSPVLGFWSWGSSSLSFHETLPLYIL